MRSQRRTCVAVLTVGWALLFGMQIGKGDAPQPTTPQQTGTLRLALKADLHSLDPAQVFTDDENMLGFFLCNTLLDISPQGSLVPVLAESLPEKSPDGRTLVFQLRHGIRFSNGQELTADDVVGSLERLFDPECSGSLTYLKSITGGSAFTEARRREAAEVNAPHPRDQRRIAPLRVDGLEALDRYRVRIRLDKPDLAFIKQLATAPCGIVSREAARQAGRSFASSPVGTGPFVVKEWVRGARIRLVRNPHFFRPDLPRPNEVDVLVNVDPGTQFMMFERGEIDCQLSILDPDFVRITRTPSLRSKLGVVAGSAPTFVALNCEMPPFDRRPVRLAMNHAVDKHRLVKLLGHRAVVSHGVVPFTVSNFREDLPEYAYDPTKARALLVEAGLPDGFETTLWTAKGAPGWNVIALYLQHCLKEIGVRVQIKEVEWAGLMEFVGRRGVVPMSVGNWSVAIDDPKETLDSLLNGDNIMDGGCLVTSFYTNPHVQQWFRDAAAELNPRRRYDLYRQIERQVVEDAPWIFLVHLNTEMVFQPWLKGYTPTGLCPPVRLEHTWLER